MKVLWITLPVSGTDHSATCCTLRPVCAGSWVSANKSGQQASEMLDIPCAERLVHSQSGTPAIKEWSRSAAYMSFKATTCCALLMLNASDQNWITSQLPCLLQWLPAAVAACCRSHLLGCRSCGTWCPLWSEGGRWDEDSGSLRRGCCARVGLLSVRRCLLARGLELQLRRLPFCCDGTSLQGKHPV